MPRLQAPRAEGGREENWFFKLSEFGDKLLAFYEENPDFIRPETRKNEIVSFVKSGLKDLSISRSTFDWACRCRSTRPRGYVWADALLAYLTGIGYGDEDERAGEFDARWPMQYHFVGKDITRFHCVICRPCSWRPGCPSRTPCSAAASCSRRARRCRSRRQRPEARRPVPRVRRWTRTATTS